MVEETKEKLPKYLVLGLFSSLLPPFSLPPVLDELKCSTMRCLLLPYFMYRHSLCLFAQKKIKWYSSERQNKVILKKAFVCRCFICRSKTRVEPLSCPHQPSRNMICKTRHALYVCYTYDALHIYDTHGKDVLKGFKKKFFRNKLKYIYLNAFC